MVAPTTDRFNWWLPFHGAAGALLAYLLVAIFGFDILEILYVLFAVPIVCLVLLVTAIFRKRQRLSILAMLGAYCTVTFGLAMNYQSVRDAGRWCLWSNVYKPKVLVQDISSDRNLKHVEWDTWGYAGIGDTVEYVVFDSNDSLAMAATDGVPGKFSGLPCEVFRVRRLESNWYAVQFYADSTWDRCN